MTPFEISQARIRALRIRRSGDDYRLTFKGPNLDESTKLRREIELPLVGDQAAESLRQVFLAIGFRPIVKVNKTREQLFLKWSGVVITVCLDQVEEVGDFVELEIVANEAEIERSKVQLHSLAETLKLEGGIRTSYLRLLLDRRDSR